MIASGSSRDMFKVLQKNNIAKANESKHVDVSVTS